jgi:hypothetical protein
MIARTMTKLLLVAALVTAIGFLFVRSRPPQHAGETPVESPAARPESSRGTSGPTKGSIWGVVTTEQGKPAQGARVAVVAADAYGLRRRPMVASTDVGGRFALTDLAPNEYVITANARGRLVSELQRLPVGAGENRKITIRLQSGHGLRGVVEDRGGGPIPGSTVQAFQESGAGAAFVDTSDEKGEFDLSLLPGRYGVLVRADGYASQYRLIDTSMLGDLEFALLPAARLAGFVLDRDERRAVEGATVTVRAEMGTSQETTSNQDGYFEFREIESGRFSVSARKNGRLGMVSAFDLDQGGREITIELTAAFTVAGRLRRGGSGGKPIAQARVEFRAASDGAVVAAGATDARGLYEIEGLPAGPYHLKATAPAHAPATREVVLGPSPRRQQVDLALDPAATVAGRVLAHDGSPVAGARVFVRLSDIPNMRDGVLSAPDGSYRLTDSPGGEVRIAAEHPTLGSAEAVLALKSRRDAEAGNPAGHGGLRRRHRHLELGRRSGGGNGLCQHATRKRSQRPYRSRRRLPPGAAECRVAPDLRFSGSQRAGGAPRTRRRSSPDRGHQGRRAQTGCRFSD